MVQVTRHVSILFMQRLLLLLLLKNHLQNPYMTVFYPPLPFPTLNYYIMSDDMLLAAIQALQPVMAVQPSHTHAYTPFL
jgi:hypothetical protein